RSFSTRSSRTRRSATAPRRPPRRAPARRSGSRGEVDSSRIGVHSPPRTPSTPRTPRGDSAYSAVNGRLSLFLPRRGVDPVELRRPADRRQVRVARPRLLEPVLERAPLRLPPARAERKEPLARPPHVLAEPRERPLAPARRARAARRRRLRRRARRRREV